MLNHFTILLFVLSQYLESEEILQGLPRLRDLSDLTLVKLELLEQREMNAVIADLQRALARTRDAWGHRMVAEAEQRGKIINKLQVARTARTAWVERMVAEAEQRGAVIEELQRALAAHWRG